MAANVLIVRDSKFVKAPVERMFELSTSIELVARTLKMKAREGVTAGHVVGGSRVLWRGWVFGLPQYHRSLISGFVTPYLGADGVWRASFQDTQEDGRFQFFQHDHRFTATDDGTLLEDEVGFSLPFGWFGHMVARWILLPHIQRLVKQRFALLKRIAESEEWRVYVLT